MCNTRRCLNWTCSLGHLPISCLGRMTWYALISLIHIRYRSMEYHCAKQLVPSLLPETSQKGLGEARVVIT